MTDFDDISDLEDDELDALYQKNINVSVKETLVRRSIPQQRTLTGSVLPGQTAYYEEIQKEVTFGPTHHSLNFDALASYIYPTNYEIREYQFNIVKKAFFENILCAIPTGMGKTFIASTVMLNFYRWAPHGKIIFTAPTRPLVAQQIKACLGITGIPSSETAILLDKSRKNREEIWKKKRVFFTTPQVVENDLKRGVLDPKDIICLVIDEAHRGTGSYAYVNVVKFIDRFNSSYRILALTATPGADIPSVQEVVNNLDISKIEIRTEESFDIARYMKNREIDKVRVSLTVEIEDIIEKLGMAVMPALQQAVELGIYDDCHPSQINAFKAMQLSQKTILNPALPEGIKWRNYFILQLLNHVGQMLKRIKIYGIRPFYSYLENKFKEFTTKYGLGKSTNKLAANFYYSTILKSLMTDCKKLISNPQFLGHEKMSHIMTELNEFFGHVGEGSRVIIFTELRESALEIVRYIDAMNNANIRPHIFIGQARGKEGFDEIEFNKKHKPKGRKKVEKQKNKEEYEEAKRMQGLKQQQEKLERSARRTASSEEAQINGMTQKQQKQVISEFKEGIFNVLVCTSIGEEGLDIGEVDLIICYDTTSSPIKNIQRMGRTGRKRDGRIVLLFSSNENSKFEKAMEDYSELQKLIKQNFLTYEKSDRIIPPNMEPQCIKQYITVNEEDIAINDLENSDDIIKYATQRMLGKSVTKKKAKSKTTKKDKSETKTQKRFFMPDGVDTGIKPASSLVTKHSLSEIPKDVDMDKIERKPFDKREVPFLEMIEKDSFGSQSPVKWDNLSQLTSNHYENFTINKREKIHAKDVPFLKTLEEDSFDSFDQLNFKFEKNESKHIEKENRIHVKNEDVNVPKTLKVTKDSKEPVKKNITPVTKKQKILPINSNNVPIDRGQSNSSSKENIPNRTQNAKLFKNVFDTNEGLLTDSEKEYFKKHYSANECTPIDAIPQIDRCIRTRIIPHSTRVMNILDTFEKINSNSKSTTISMNRIQCIARGIANGRSQVTDPDCSVIISDTE